MKRHVFKATKLGWKEEADGIWFDANLYSREEAEAQFRPVERFTVKNNYAFPYTAYEYDGVIYHHFRYLGIYDENEMPGNNT